MSSSLKGVVQGQDFRVKDLVVNPKVPIEGYIWDYYRGYYGGYQEFRL